MSTTKPVRPRCFGWSGSVRQMISPMSLYCAPDVHTFWPVITHSSPSRSARVWSPARSEPAPGSLNSWQPTMSPRYMPGRYALLARLGGVGEDRRGDHAEADAEERRRAASSYSRLEAVVGAAVARGQPPAAELGRAGDPAEAGVVAGGPPLLRRRRAAAASSAGSTSSKVATSSSPSPHTKRCAVGLRLGVGVEERPGLGGELLDGRALRSRSSGPLRRRHPTFEVVSALRPRSAAALVAWTLLTWVGRVPLLWSDEEQSTAAKLGSTVPVLVFVGLAVAAVVLLLRRRPWTNAVAVLAVWSIGYWAVRYPLILTNDHPAALHGRARGAGRRGDRPVGVDPRRPQVRSDTSSASVRQRQPPPAFRNSPTSQVTTSKPQRLELAADPDGRGRHHDRAAHHDRVGAEAERLLVLEPQRLGHERLDHLAAVGVPAHRRADRAAVVERTERDVDVVQPLVDELDGAHGRAGQPGQLGGGRQVGPEPVAGQEAAAEGERVARALVVEVLGQAGDLVALRPRTTSRTARSRAGAPGSGSATARTAAVRPAGG